MKSERKQAVTGNKQAARKKSGSKSKLAQAMYMQLQRQFYYFHQHIAKQDFQRAAEMRDQIRLYIKRCLGGR